MASNCNGGFYYFPAEQLRPFQESWTGFAEFLFARPDLFPDERFLIHIDQISYGLSVADLGMPLGHLSANWNFPLHRAHVPSSFSKEESVRLLHHHHELDDFGLLKPSYCDDHGLIDEAVVKVNQLIARQKPTTIFYDWKKDRAVQAVTGVRVIDPIQFPRDLQEKAILPNGQKRRIILHGGTPKTGTSSLQFYLHQHREALAQKGYFYPPPLETKMPKHQQLVGLFCAGQAAPFFDYLRAAMEAMPKETHTIIFSTEGIYNHWWDFSCEGKALLRVLAEQFDFELCVFLRAPKDFVRALYAEYLKNPQLDGVTKNVYGQDISVCEMVEDPWFLRHLDYLGFALEVRALLGEESLTLRPYTQDVVGDFLHIYGIDDMPPVAGRKNISLGQLGVDFIRQVNRANMTMDNKEKAVELVYALEDLVEGRIPFRLTPEECAFVDYYATRVSLESITGEELL